MIKYTILEQIYFHNIFNIDNIFSQIYLRNMFSL